jgi:hypothetical protein
MTFNMKMTIAMSVVIIAFLFLVNSTINTAKVLIDEHDSVATRVAKCVTKEYEANPERKSIQEYCEAQVRLDEDEE